MKVSCSSAVILSLFCKCAMIASLSSSARGDRRGGENVDGGKSGHDDEDDGSDGE